MAADPRLLANAIRALSMDAVQAANSGHPGMPMGMADVATILFTEYLKHDPADPAWHDRDRFVLSAGHGSMLIYSLLHLTGYAHPTIEEIANFRQLGSPCAGHPENFMLDGVEATTGPLGQGLAMAVGMAIAERHLNAVFGDDLVDHRTWVIAGDGDLMEGHQPRGGRAGRASRPRPAQRLLGRQQDHHRRLDRPVALRGHARPLRARAAGTPSRATATISPTSAGRIDEALADPRPSLIACRTIIGWGAPNKQGTAATHGAALGADEVAAARKQLVWDSEPFDIPEPILARLARGRGRAAGRRMRNSARRLAASPRARRVRPPDGRAAAREARPRRLARRARRRPAEDRHPQGVGAGAGGDQRRVARDDRRLGRPDRFEQYQNKGPEASDERGLFRPLHLLRHPRVRNGRGDERDGAARRRHPLWRHLPGLLRLLPPRHPPLGAAGRAGHLRDDPRFRSASARTARPTSRSSI